jgi:glycosyltransferase involved in cell wall biosynthesis
MNITITLEHKFCRTPDGTVWSRSQFPYSFWRNYLELFDEVQVVARVLDVEEADADWLPASGTGVAFSAVPYYVGPLAFARNYLAIRKSIGASIAEDSAVILRVGSPIGTIAHSILRRRGQPFGVCVVTDPKTAFARGVIDHPLRPFLRWKLTRDLRCQCAAASVASYVTESYLQGMYPPSSEAFVTSLSSVELTDDAFVNEPRTPSADGRKRIITVVSLAQRYKGVDTLLDAFHECVQHGLDLELVVVGGGIYQAELEDQARRLGLLGDRVRFLGMLPGARAVREELSQSDLFVLASKTEAQGRAILEAMAQGLPCVGSNTGGIPELVLPADLAPPGDAKQLATVLRGMLGDPERMARAARHGLDAARRFHADKLKITRDRFLRELAEQTRAWQLSHGVAEVSSAT